MRQTLHVLVVDLARRRALAGRVGSKWMLPILDCGERARAGPLVARWCVARGISGDLVGQWLGRVSEHSADWLMAVAASGPCRPTDPALKWISLDSLAAGAAVLEYQQWAVAGVLADSATASVDGPFGNFTWPEAVRAWIAAAIGSEPSVLTPYRVSSHEVVLGADCAHGRVYFKGLMGERAAEARLTQALHVLAPDSFARTLALEERGTAVWWLTEASPGLPAQDAHVVAAALAQMQQRVIACAGPLALEIIDLEPAAQWGSELLGDPALAAAVRHACGQAMGAPVPRSWVPMDLDPGNVLVDSDGAVRFIDIDDSFAGPGALAMAPIAQRYGDGAAFATYARSWSPPLERVDWESVNVAAAVLHAWLGWKRLTRNVERGEVHAALDRVRDRIRERLVKTLTAGRSPMQSPPGGRAA